MPTSSPYVNQHHLPIIPNHFIQLYTPEGSSDTVQTFYSVHVMSYCQGTVTSSEPGDSVSRNVTQCSNRTIPFAFNPTEALSAEVSPGPTLDWPRVISDDFHAFRVPSQAMTVLYIIGLGATGFALFARASSFIKPHTQSGLFEFGFLVVRHHIPAWDRATPEKQHR